MALDARTPLLLHPLRVSTPRHQNPPPFSHPSCSPARLYLQFNLLHLCTERVHLFLQALDLCIPVDKGRLVPCGSGPSPLLAPPYLSSQTPLGGPKVCSNRSEVIWGGQRVLS